MIHNDCSEIYYNRDSAEDYSSWQSKITTQGLIALVFESLECNFLLDSCSKI